MAGTARPATGRSAEFVPGFISGALTLVATKSPAMDGASVQFTGLLSTKRYLLVFRSHPRTGGSLILTPNGVLSQQSTNFMQQDNAGVFSSGQVAGIVAIAGAGNGFINLGEAWIRPDGQELQIYSNFTQYQETPGLRQTDGEFKANCLSDTLFSSFTLDTAIPGGLLAVDVFSLYVFSQT